MSKQLSAIPNAKPVQFVILGSMTMGASSLTAQGFDYVQTIDMETIESMIRKLEKIEMMWGRRFRQWQKEGAMGDSPVEICPGVIAWVVSIVSEKLNDLQELTNLLGQVADRLQFHAPHAEVRFDDCSLDARAIASAMVGALRGAIPIAHPGQAVNRSERRASRKMCRARAAIS